MLARRSLFLGRDIKVMKNVSRHLPTQSGKLPNIFERFLQGRRINNILRRAQIRPEWIRAVEDPATDMGTLHRIKRKMGIISPVGQEYDEAKYYLTRFWDKARLAKWRGLETGGDVGMDRAQLVRDIRNRMITRIQEQRRVAPDGTVLERIQGGAEEIYEAVNKSLGGNATVARGAEAGKESSAASKTVKATSEAAEATSGASEGAKAAGEVARARPSTEAVGAKFAEAVRTSAKAQEALKTLTLEPKLLKALDESPEFARFFVRHLETARDPAALLRPLNAAASTPEEAAFIGRVMGTERGFARVLADVERGKDVARALSSASKLSRIGRTLKFTGRALPLVADALAGYGAVMEMIETADHIAKLRKEGKVREEVIRLEEQRYYYQAAHLGVSGVGLGAGAFLVVGVGTTVAWPVALATLPVSAIIYGAYEGHKWKEAQERTSEDWQNEIDLISLLADVRTYTFGERVGHAWELARPLDAIVQPLAVVPHQIYRHLSGQTMEETKELIQRIRSVDERKVRAIVAHTTTVTIPNTVRGEDGRERPLTETEVTQYQEASRRYVDAKAAFLLSRREDSMHPIRSNGDITDLIEGAESAGLLARDLPQLKVEREKLLADRGPASLERAEMIRQILEEKDPVKQAALYGTFLRQEHIKELYATLLTQVSVQSEGDREFLRAPLTKVIRESILSTAQHAYVNFCVLCEEENLKNWWPDGDAQRVARLYASERMEEIADEKGNEISAMVLATGDAQVDQGMYKFQLAMNDAKRDIERFLSNPKGVWANMPPDAKLRLGYKFMDDKGEGMPERFRDRIRKGELLMGRISANYNGSYYTKQFGWWGNKYLYVTFDCRRGKWLAGLGSIEGLQEPSAFRCTMWGGSEKYNLVLQALDAINGRLLLYSLPCPSKTSFKNSSQPPSVRSPTMR